MHEYGADKEIQNPNNLSDVICERLPAKAERCRSPVAYLASWQKAPMAAALSRSRPQSKKGRTCEICTFCWIMLYDNDYRV